MTTLAEAFELAVQHYQAGDLQQAEQLSKQVLQADPGHAETWHLLGMIALQVGRYDAAVEALRQAIALKSDCAEAYDYLGITLRRQGKLDEAAASYRQAIRLQPENAEAHNNLGNVLRDQGKLDEAAAHYRQALGLKPDYVLPHNNLGVVLRGQGKLDEAVACNQQAIRLRPDLPEAHNHLGNARRDQGRIDDAVGCFRKALGIRPSFVGAHDNLLYTLLFHPGFDREAISSIHRRWNDIHAEGLRAAAQPHANDRSSTRRLRIGYVSPNFRDHVVGRNLMPLLREHDHQQFAVYCYADLACPDAVTAKLQGCADVWRSSRGLNDQHLADLVRQDEIDILVDLTLHMESNRLLMFARKPAPVQAAFAGYPGSTGLWAMDYRLTDPHLDPPGMDDRYYSEASVRLPETFWCYDPPAPDIEVNPLPALANGYVTFGCFNDFCKINETVVSLWSRVLNAVDHSRLLLLAPEGSPRQAALEQFNKHGVSSSRITFAGHQPRMTYMALYHSIDVGLDTIPYNGHTTSLDSYWMGVPVLTMAGRTVVGRAGVSQANNLRLPEMVATSPGHFVEAARALAGDLARLATLRAKLRGRMASSPLCDARRFARNIETAYRSMWQRWCVGEKPMHPS